MTSSTAPHLKPIYKRSTDIDWVVIMNMEEFDESKHYNTNEIAKKFNQLLRALKNDKS